MGCGCGGGKPSPSNRVAPLVRSNPNSKVVPTSVPIHVPVVRKREVVPRVSPVIPKKDETPS